MDYLNADSDLPVFPTLLGTKNGLAGIRQYVSQMVHSNQDARRSWGKIGNGSLWNSMVATPQPPLTPTLMQKERS